MSARVNPFFSPTQISGCQLWLDAADSATVLLSGTSVTGWRDKSGNGYHATAFNSPAYIPFSSNYRGITLNGSSTYLYASNATAMNTTANLSAFVVAQASFGSMGQFARLLSFGDPDYNTGTNCVAFNRLSTNNQIMYERVGYPSPSQTLSSTASFVGSVVFTTTGITQLINGSPNASTSGSYTSFSYSLYNIGRYSGGGFHWAGMICEVIAYSASLTTAQVQQVEGYLAWKWGLQGSLPANHPYKASPIPPLLSPPVSLPQASQPVIQPITWFPTQISGCQLWLDGIDATNFVFSSGSNISSWRDKSGNGRNATGVNSPTYNASSNGVSFVKASAQYFTLPDGTYPAGNSSYSYLFIFSPGAVTLSQILSGGTFATGQMTGIRAGNAGTGTLQTYWIGYDLQTSSTYTLNRKNFGATYYASGGGRSLWLNFLQGAADTPGTRSQTTSNNQIGNLYTFTTEYYSGQIHELIVYNSSLSTTERQQVEGYLAWKWNLVGSLPAAHPYKSFPPFLPAAAVPPRALAQPTVWTPTRISGCQIWLDGTDPLGTGASLAPGTPIPRWVNKGTSSLTLSNAGGFPTSFTNAQNRRGTVSFSGAYYDGSFTFSLATKSVFLICSQSNSSADSPQGILSFIGAGNDTVASTDGFGYQATQDGWGSFGWLYNIFQSGVGAPSPSTGYYITYGVAGNPTPFGMYASVLSNQYEQAFVNGSNTSNFTITTNPGTSTTLRVGARMIGGALRGQLYGTIGEILIYNIGLSSNQRYQVEGYLAWKWGLQGSLPANHPWKLWPPPP